MKSQPKLAITRLDTRRHEVTNTQLAATIAALDVPLSEHCPYVTQAGDGVHSGEVRVVWNFDGQRANDISRLWSDEVWLAANPAHPVSVCRRAFRTYRELISFVRGVPCRIENCNGSGSTATPDTRKASCMEALGHKLLGYSRIDDSFFWHFAKSPELHADFDLYDKRDLCQALPDANISYARAALHNHAVMVRLIKDIQQVRVAHRGRIAVIGVNAPQSVVDTIDKYLHRK